MSLSWLSFARDRVYCVCRRLGLLVVEFVKSASDFDISPFQLSAVCKIGVFERFRSR